MTDPPEKSERFSEREGSEEAMKNSRFRLAPLTVAFLSRALVHHLGSDTTTAFNNTVHKVSS